MDFWELAFEEGDPAESDAPSVLCNPPGSRASKHSPLPGFLEAIRIAKYHSECSVSKEKAPKEFLGKLLNSGFAPRAMDEIECKLGKLEFDDGTIRAIAKEKHLAQSTELLLNYKESLI
ncbi:hypothetical protein SLS54_010466 [Diplodia seriata]